MTKSKCDLPQRTRQYNLKILTMKAKGTSLQEANNMKTKTQVHKQITEKFNEFNHLGRQMHLKTRI